jgi:hypothetical protein
LNGSTLDTKIRQKRLTRGHDEVDLRLGHDVNEGPHQTRRFTLTDEGRSSCDDGLSARHVHSLEEEPRKVLDDPLHDAEVIQHLHKRNEEDDSGELQ